MDNYDLRGGNPIANQRSSNGFRNGDNLGDTLSQEQAYSCA
jgi:hypothetical protein